MTRALVGLLGCCVLMLGQALGQASLRSTDDVVALAERTMERVVAGDYEEAFGGLRPYWAFPMSEIDALLETTRAQRERFSGRFGASLDYRLVHVQELEDVLVKLTFMERTERHALRWTFLFYKPQDEWIVNSIEWDDDVEALLAAGE